MLQLSGATTWPGTAQPHRCTPGTPPGAEPPTAPGVRLQPAGSTQLQPCLGSAPCSCFLIPRPCSDPSRKANPRGSACPKPSPTHPAGCAFLFAPGGCRQSPAQGWSQQPGLRCWRCRIHSGTRLLTEAGALQTLPTPTPSLQGAPGHSWGSAPCHQHSRGKHPQHGRS